MIFKPLNSPNKKIPANLKPHLLKIFILFLLVVFLSAIRSHAAQEDNIEEEVKNAQEASAAAPRKGNWVPVPIPVSNPTIGSGLQAVLMYLHPKKRGEESSHNATSGLLGMYTNTDSWFTGIFHDDYWANDRYRFTGIVGYGELNLKYYGVGDSPFLSKYPIDYEFKAFLFVPKFQVRIPATDHWFGGLQYLFIDSDSVFKLSQLHPLLPDFYGHIRSAGLGLLTTFDSRDDNYYPTKGQYFEAKWTNYGESWGGDYQYNKFRTFLNYYQPIADPIVLALRANADLSSGDTPFFDLPYLDMRGFARGRYQDNLAVSLHAEGRYKFMPRWGAVAFVESGRYGEDYDGLLSSRTIVSYGGGIRWQVTKNKKMNLGIDVAFSTDDQAIYVQVGESF